MAVSFLQTNDEKFYLNEGSPGFYLAKKKKDVNGESR